jgi:tripartite-type tricarboxylate transporter receptor subunit TctC
MKYRFCKSLVTGFSVAGLLFAAAVMNPAASEDWPRRPVTVIVPFGAGGPVDAVARFVAHQLEETLKTPFIIDNRSGASGNIGAAAVARAKPDGYTLLFATPFPMGLNRMMSDNVSFNPTEDLVPIVMIGKSPQILLSSATGRIQSFQQLVETGK